MKKFLSVIVVLFVSACSYTGNTHPAEYGNKKITDSSDKIIVGIDIASVKNLLGEPSRIYKATSKQGQEFEYEYHDASRSALYFIPGISVLYAGFSINPFNISAKSVRAEVKHKYLFIEFDKNGLVSQKKFLEESNSQKFYMNPGCSTQGYTTRCYSSKADNLISY